MKELKKTEVKISRKRKEQTNRDVKYFMKFIDNIRFMWTSLSILVDNISDKLHGKE